MIPYILNNSASILYILNKPRMNTEEHRWFSIRVYPYPSVVFIGNSLIIVDF